MPTSSVTKAGLALILLSATATAATAPRVDTSAEAANVAISRLIVKLAPGKDSGALSATLERAGRASGRRLTPLRQLATGGWLIQAEDSAGSAALLGPDETARLMHDVARDPSVASIEPDRLLKPAFTPNDEHYVLQPWYFRERVGTNTAGAWHYSTGAGVNVAVIDTGIVPHSDLAANVLDGYDFITDAAAARDGDGRDANPNDEGDWYAVGECPDVPGDSKFSGWHGTHVAGSIAALANNASKGIAGMAHHAKIVPVRVLGRCGGTVSDIAEALIWASGGAVSGTPVNANPASVLNLSLNAPGSCSTTMQDAIDAAVANGAVVVVAAGNNASNVDYYTPANCEQVVTVAATDLQGQIHPYSNYGDRIDVAAPGQALSTIDVGTTVQAGEGYRIYIGTSTAAPQVSSLAAMILAEGPFTPRQVENLMKYNGTALLDCTFDAVKSCGWGLIDALHTLRAVGAGYDGNAVSTPIPSFFPKPTYFENTANYYVPATGLYASSPNTVWGQYGANGPAGAIVNFKLAVRGTGSVNPRDFRIALVGVNGSTIKVLHDRGTVLTTTQSINASAFTGDGIWSLVAKNFGTANNVYIDSWSLSFPGGGGPL
ncbi:MAG TPA: S8 family serine peptidase [Tahibacter sp.]|uniref:S8 family serine peptidase n=1 Tax=Tahibacter sp. TaxID=2056211 RepID=UPI002C59BE47|nr:S8 family serine peptidase [Tahibacter sp.]HSX59071.1 S8 family serine peptidase [Tahibacter sp.]